MDNLRILKQAYDDYEAERKMVYDKLSRLLANPDLTFDPVIKTKKLIAEIAALEAKQEIAAGFMKQITATAAESHNDESHDHEELEAAEESDENEDIGE